MKEKLLSLPGFSLRIRTFDTLPSTSTYLAALAREGEKEGLLVVAKEQSEGKGRFARRFFSPPRTGIYMSLLLRPSFPAEHLPLLTPLAGTAAAEAAEAISGACVGIKWVNDLYLNGRKIAGILAECGTSQNANNSLQNSQYVIIGIGINLSMPPSVPPELAGKMGALFEGEAPSGAGDTFIEAFLSRFFAYYEKMPAPLFLDAYRKRSVLIGKRVLLHNAAFDTAREGAGEPVTVLGIDDGCALVVRGKDGLERRIGAGEVTLSLN